MPGGRTLLRARAFRCCILPCGLVCQSAVGPTVGSLTIVLHPVALLGAQILQLLALFGPQLLPVLLRQSFCPQFVALTVLQALQLAPVFPMLLCAQLLRRLGSMRCPGLRSVLTRLGSELLPLLSLRLHALARDGMTRRNALRLCRPRCRSRHARRGRHARRCHPRWR